MKSIQDSGRNEAKWRLTQAQSRRRRRQEEMKVAGKQKGTKITTLGQIMIADYKQ